MLEEAKQRAVVLECECAGAQLLESLDTPPELILCDVRDAERLDEADAEADVVRSVLALAGLCHDDGNIPACEVPCSICPNLALDAQYSILGVIGED